MFIKVEPKDWMMYSVYLYFSDDRGDAEDAPIKRYLSDHGLQPKRTFDERVDDTDFEVMSFGGCYIGRGHLQAVTRIQEGVVERELLTDEIRRVLDSPDGGVSDENLDTLVEQLHGQTTFETDDNGRIVVVLDASAVRESHLRLQG